MDPTELMWHVDRKGGRTIYAKAADAEEVMIGSMDTPELAQRVIESHNTILKNPNYGDATAELEGLQESLNLALQRLMVADAFVDWILAMDDPLDAAGRTRRQRINLAWIFDEARVVFNTRPDQKPLA